MNILTHVIYFVINIVIGIWLVPFFIHKIGIESYGFIPLATSITFYASIVTLSLNSAVSRYLTINLQQNNTLEANKTFNTSLVISIFFVLLLLPVSICISYYADYVFDIPPKILNEGRILFLIVFISFLFSLLSNPFTVSTFSLNRLDLSNLINIINVAVRTAVVVVLFEFFSPSLYSVGISFFVAAIASFIAGYIICRKISPMLKVNFKYYDKSRFGTLTKMSSWLTINQIGTLLFVNIDLIIINIIFGALKQGQYAALIQMSILLRNISFILSRATGPMIYISYAKNEMKKIITILKSSVKFMGIVLAFPIGIICGFGAPLLKIWIGPEYVRFVPLLWIITAPLIINLGIQPLYSISNAANKVKVPGIVTLILGVFNVAMAIILSLYTSLGIYAVAITGACILTIKNGIFTTLYSSYILKIKKLAFIRPVFAGLMLAFAIFCFAFGLSYIVHINNWISLLLYSIIVCLPFLPLIWFFMINKEEKEILSSMVFNIFNKIQ